MLEVSVFLMRFRLGLDEQATISVFLSHKVVSLRTYNVNL